VIVLQRDDTIGVIYRMRTPQDVIIEQLEAKIQTLKHQLTHQQMAGNDECMEMVKNLMEEIRELKKNLNVVESILRSSLPVLNEDNNDTSYID